MLVEIVEDSVDQVVREALTSQLEVLMLGSGAMFSSNKKKEKRKLRKLRRAILRVLDYYAP